MTRLARFEWAIMQQLSMPLRFTIALLLLAGVVFATESEKDFGAYKAKEIRKSDVWLNSAPMTLKSLKGKVVVIDFWAFDCEPCVQAMPHIVELYDKYAKDGLVVIGVHTPRADYEQDVSKLREAITKMGIKFPVVVDGKQKIFRDYLCDLWPSQFVIDRSGIVRYSHGGVGRYDDMEQVIERLLKTD
jgi:thiol-disulfide isomerase/thioredoxin